MKERIRVALVDDHRVVASSLKAYLESFPDFEVVGVASSGEELLLHLEHWKPQVVLQDLLMPGGLDGIETTRRVTERSPSTSVIALTASIDEARMMGVLRAGASGYLRKDASPGHLLEAVRAVARGESYVDPSVASELLTAGGPSPDALTARELEVLRRLVFGRSNKEIADELCISEETVKTHVRHVLSKMQADNRVQATVQAVRRGLVMLEELDERQLR